MINSIFAQAANIPVVVRDDKGVTIATDTIPLALTALCVYVGDGQTSGDANIRGPSSSMSVRGQISALAIRIPVAHTFTTLPALVR